MELWKTLDVFYMLHMLQFWKCWMAAFARHWRIGVPRCQKRYAKIRGLDWATVIQWLPSDAINAELKPVLETYLQRCHQRDAYQRAILQRKAKL